MDLIQPRLYNLNSVVRESCVTRDPPEIQLSDNGKLRKVYFGPRHETTKCLNVIGYLQVSPCIHMVVRRNGPAV